MNLTAVLLTGLLAGGVSCAAVQGGLLAALIARQRATPASSASAASPHSSRSGKLGGMSDRAAPPAIRTRDRANLEVRRPVWARLSDDLTPVAGFLVGKLLSHTLLGALLGALGATVRPSVHISAAVQILAGALVIVFGLAQLGVPGFRRISIGPPLSLGKLVLRSARSRSAFAPGLLGLASIFIPCGVTLSVEALALTAGSASAGAATMAVFVLGTSPLFTVLGYAIRKAATAWRGRLAAATGLVLLAMGLITFNGGLEAAGSPLAASRLTARLAPATASPAALATVSDGRQTVTITASAEGYAPATIHARAGLPTTLIIRSEGAQGCLRAFTVPDRNLEKILPATGETTLELGTLQPGTLAYACGMGMYTGTIAVN